jgi:hypothetical protein
MLLRISEKTSVKDLIKWMAILTMLTALILGADFVRTVYAGQKSRLEENWGKSFEAAKANQILNPDAGKRLEPVTGLNAKGAEEAVRKYQNSFKKEAAQPVYNINISDIGSN